MKKTRFTETQFVAIHKEADSGILVQEYEMIHDPFKGEMSGG